jgi:hypothetical protein
MTDCDYDHTPNAVTESALWESVARQGMRVVRALLAEAVADRERSDACIAAVAAAEDFLGAVTVEEIFA